MFPERLLHLTARVILNHQYIYLSSSSLDMFNRLFCVPSSADSLPLSTEETMEFEKLSKEVANEMIAHCQVQSDDLEERRADRQEQRFLAWVDDWDG